MEDDSRRSKVAMKRKRNRLPAGSTSVHDLSDDHLELVLLGVASPVSLVRAAATCKRWRRVVAGTDGELVLLGVASPVSLVRAAATCKRWRRVVAGTDGAFLRRFRALHAPRAVGTYYSINRDTPCSYGGSHLWPKVDPVYVPLSESTSDDGPTSGLQLSLDFVLAGDPPRELVDGRGSLLLLLKEKDGTKLPDSDCICCMHHSDEIIPDLVVCEPLTRRYQAIPPPDNRVCILGAFLLDGCAGEGGGGDIGVTNFRVLLVLYGHAYNRCSSIHNGHGYPSASVFTCGSNGGGWHGEDDYDDGGVYLPRLEEIHLAGRTGGRIYWVCDDRQVVVLVEHTLEFSTMALPDHMTNNWDLDRGNFRVVNRDAAGTTRIVHLTSGGDLEVFGQLHGHHGTDNWVLEMKVQVIEARRGLPGHKEKYFATGSKIIDADEGLVVLCPDKKRWLFSVDLETMEIKREYRRKNYTGPAFQYTLPWPPVMRACVENGRKRRKRRRKRRPERRKNGGMDSSNLAAE